MDQDSEMFRFLMKFYRNGEYEDKRFFQRLNNPDISGLKVLEVGCGTGSLAIHMASKMSPAKVVAFDLDEQNIDFANSNLEYNHSDFKNTIHYCVSTCSELLNKNERFDCIVSKDSFEHIIAFEDTFDEMWNLLKPGGRLMAGFGPLYYSPRGGHSLTVLPFDHILLPEKTILRRYNRRKNRDIKSVWEYGLNKFSLDDYLNVFKKYAIKPEFIRFNQSDKFFGKVASQVLRFPILRKLTFNVYLILKKANS